MSVDNGKIGDWNRVEKMLESFGSKFQQNIQQATDNSGELLAANIEAVFEAQNFAPLKPKYLRWKYRHGYSELILYLGGTLRGSVKYHKRDWRGGFVGILRNVQAKSPDGKSAGPLVNIAAVHEFGSRDGRIPARPYIAPGFGKSRAAMLREYEDAIERTFK
jgi:phage gpG-like protein